MRTAQVGIAIGVLVQWPLTVMIPHLETPDQLEIALQLWQAAVPQPWIIVVDTGSSAGVLDRVRSMRADNVEVMEAGTHGVRHASEPVAIACDLAMSACRTEVLLFTHSDVFIRDRNIPRFFVESVTAKYPAVGYRMSPRDNSDWQWMLSHTLTGLHIPTMDRIGATWSMRRCFTRLGVAYTTAGMVGVTWPDTESGVNYCLRDAGIKPVFLGDETNAQRHVDERLDHCRSMTCGKLYSPAHFARVQEWLRSAEEEARQRAVSWVSRGPVGRVDARGRFTGMISFEEARGCCD